MQRRESTGRLRVDSHHVSASESDRDIHPSRQRSVDSGSIMSEEEREKAAAIARKRAIERAKRYRAEQEEEERRVQQEKEELERKKWRERDAVMLYFLYTTAYGHFHTSCLPLFPPRISFFCYEENLLSINQSLFRICVFLFISNAQRIQQFLRKQEEIDLVEKHQLHKSQNSSIHSTLSSRHSLEHSAHDVPLPLSESYSSTEHSDRREEDFRGGVFDSLLSLLLFFSCAIIL